MSNQNLDNLGAYGPTSNFDADVPTRLRGDQLYKKYKEMAERRKDYDDIDIKDCIPNLNEMIQSDLMYDILEGVADGDTEKDVLDTAFYTQNPPSTKLGYDKSKNVFIYKIQNIKFKESDKDLNKIDGDTFRVPLKNIIEPTNASDKEIDINGTKFKDFKEYCYKKGLVDKNKNDDEQLLQVRLIGIDSPEIPHLDVMPLKSSDIVTMTINEARKKHGATIHMLKYAYSNGKTTERTDLNIKREFYKVKGKEEYHEIIADNPSYLKKLNSEKTDKSITYKKIVVYDDSNFKTLSGGYKAQEKLISLLESGTVYVMLDANGLKANKTVGTYKITYNHWWNAKGAISNMIDQWCSYTNNPTLTRLSYSPFGTDGHGRFIGEAYVMKNDLYTNLGKYVLADSETKTVRYTATSSPELDSVGGDNAAVFDLGSYNKNNQLWLDAFSEMTKDSYNERLEFHKQITGIDFSSVRGCTMMIGDTLFVIPPQNIRSLSSIDYEKVGIMRGKGSMVKNNTNRDMFLEVDLYFYNGTGINGIPVKVVTPSGEELTYYMNGLRSLLAQFKVAPYLPIENEFINDVLNIEAVSLMNISVSTVEGFPRLLKATLTMRDFNYRIYMPDIPIDYSNNQTSEFAKMNPIFAKCFHWEVFRFYYQRIIRRGEYLKTIEYNSTEYYKELYNTKEALQPAWFCEKDGYSSSGIDFYIPDEDWLKAALSVKKDKDYYGQQLETYTVSDNAKKWISSMEKAAKIVDQKPNVKKLFEDKTVRVKDGIRYKQEIRGCYSSKSTNLVSDKDKKLFDNKIKPILKPYVEMATSSDAVSISINEILNTDTKVLTYQMCLSLKVGTLSSTDISSIKESVRDALGLNSTTNIFKNNQLIISLTFKLLMESITLNEDNRPKFHYILDTSRTPSLTGRTVKVGATEITDLKILQAFANGSVGEGKGTKDTNETAADMYDYMDPSKMPFVPYNPETIELQALTFGLSNNFSDITLKIMDGFAPQYMGSSDAVIDISFVTNNQITISMMNNLPAHASNIGKAYRRILNCWPIRVRNHYLQLAGINEVLIDLVEIQNLEGFPGFYEVHMRMTSVDRTMRQRETLKQLESDQKTSKKVTASLYSYWDIENVLATAELYPDLDLPTIKELELYGYYFIKYRQSNQAYPDPDFYMSYGFPYTSYIIKKNLKDTFYNQIFHDGEREKSEILDDSKFEFFDQMGMTLYKKLCPYSGFEETEGKDGKTQNALADAFDKEAAIIEDNSDTDLQKTKKGEADEIADRDCANLSDLLIFLTACDMSQGWTLKPGFTAPVVISQTNLDVENLSRSGLDKDDEEPENAYANDIFDLRAELIRAIDNYLKNPIEYSRYNFNTTTYNPFNAADGYGGVISRVAEKFADDKAGRKILELLNPFETTWNVQELTEWQKLKDLDNNYQLEPDYSVVCTLNYLCGFLYSAAKCISAECTFDPDEKKGLWEPRQYKIDKDGKIIKDDEGNKVPLCKMEKDGKPLGDANTLEEALENGVQWGMFQIKLYKSSELKKMLQPKSRVTYLSEKELPMYKDKDGNERWHPGFIDPYYNLAGYKSKVGKEYIKQIATNEGVNCIAFIRVMLMHLRRMVIDGEIFSEIDVIAKDFDSIKETIAVKPDGDDFNEGAKDASDTLYNEGGVFGLVGVMMDQGIVDGLKSYIGFGDLSDETQIEAIADAVGSEEAAEQIYGLIEDIPNTYKRSFCARLVLPILMATTEGSKDFDTLLKTYNLSELNGLTTGSIISESQPTHMIARYCKAMGTTGMLSFDSKDTPEETTSDSQRLWNYIMREAYTKLADDPQAYVLHSYYDMLINDKRGRLVRAFPTYYVVFMDEGRKIGSWKLFDNFYNMSAISEITVSKSRKIPADTCSFVMSNMYGSYAAEYDNTTRQQYVDTYGYRDVFHSIFCPDAYANKEDALRRRDDNLETVILQPGVRIHVRMGYGSDASRIPVVFNGKIAEIDVGEVVQVVAQGDGIELCNPLNTLGDIDAVELTEAQSKCTLFKDIRGSMKRGGESPRNLLTKLLTAKHGGIIKSFTRWWSGDRWYGDNPFGIYHFGDNRFNYIFQEGETVQNLYEVCDATLLKGSNELYTSSANTMATPTINTTIQDKTFWDILHLCANSGVNFVGAVRDFGMRSTICLCKPNHYVAYGYKKIDDDEGETEGKMIERRKPFQQYHFYDSYSDIVYNSIKASEKNMKTNAVGIWESTDMIWGKSQSTVGPIYLDMNIFPEYQKSMTVDTGLVSDGKGGLELNIFTHFAENWASDANDNKVNKALAERVTTNVLRESVSNMYCGELCVLGDTAIKPYDRFYVNDFYEDMMGQMEVEAVVYSMNSATGFTTTIYPDCIVRADDNHEAARQLISGAFIGSIVAGVSGRNMAIHAFARTSSSMVTSLGKIATGIMASPADEALGLSALGKFLKIDKCDDIAAALKTLGTEGAAAFSLPAIVSAIAIAATVYVLANNAKSAFGSFLKNIQALTVYPIVKNQRPLIAGMSGHKGSVMGYEYTEEDAKDSIQGLIYNSVQWLNNITNDKGDGKYSNPFPFSLGDSLMSALTRKVDANGNKISEYDLAVNKWAQTLPLIDGEAQFYKNGNETITEEQQREIMVQTLHGNVSTEKAMQGQYMASLRTKWRLPNLVVTDKDRLADEVYKSYHIANINSINDLATSEKILELYPIEDELEIKQAIAGSHSNVKEMHIAHSKGNAKVQIPFESGNRIIKFFTEAGSNAYVYDLPMLQEDALMILKLLLDDQALKGKQISFLSGARINDVGTWKSTGFAFMVDSKSHKALGNALENLSKTLSGANGDGTPVFEYKDKGDEGFLVITYAPIRKNNN